KIPERDYSSKDYFAVQFSNIDEMTSFKEIFTNFTYEHSARGLSDYYVFSIPKEHEHSKLLGNINNNDHVLMKRDCELYNGLIDSKLKSLSLLPPRKLYKRYPAQDKSMEKIYDAEKRLGIDDPLFEKQWHLLNPSFPGHDINVTGVWYNGITGTGVVTAIVDDGLDYESRDLSRAFCEEGSWDFNDNQKLPKPKLNDDYHGTRCASEIAAEKGNDYCGVGVAYNSKVSGIRILSAQITSEDEAAALIYGLDVNDIYSCSWGPPDDGKSMQAPDTIVKSAIIKGVLDGRDKKGAIYVFASGNGGLHGDNCNFDGYTNSIYSITVSAIDHKGLHPPYAESCSAVLVTTYSSGSGEFVNTGDIKGSCTNRHGGTSAAAPLAAGIYSLVLEANPQLSWRDVQYLSVLSSVEVNSQDGSWQNTAISKRYSHKYGFGKIDAYAIVEMAKNWTNLKPQAWYYAPLTTVNQQIENDGSVTTKTVVKREELEDANVESLEQVTVTVNIDADIRGKVKVKLTSPSGIVSELAPFRKLDEARDGFQDWTFMSVAHWGESGEGDWELEVSGTDNTKINVRDWRLKFFGECIDPSKAKRFPLPGHENDPDVYLTTSTQTSLSTTQTIVYATLSSSSPSSSSSSSSIAATVTTSKNNESEETGKFQHSTDHGHTVEYLFFLFVIGFVVCLYILMKSSNKNRRRRRRDEFEFDILQPEDEYDS
ncbi:hypothetical protein PACTADRAFT_29311, partial [Pachysolen tannophilus NRRL Y-2460]